MFFVGGAGSCLKRLLFRCPTIRQLVLVRTVDTCRGNTKAGGAGIGAVFKGPLWGVVGR